jgi:branched-subunit amino acid ABC-type transport system permease component
MLGTRRGMTGSFEQRHAYFNGLQLFLIASELTLNFGVTGIINVAHSAFFMLGA